MRFLHVSLAALLPLASALADHFDDHGPAVLATVAQSPSARRATNLKLSRLVDVGHPIVGADGSAFLVVRTDEGNWAKLLARPARLRLRDQQQPVDLLLVERLVTYSSDPRRGPRAERKDVYLFSGFGLDLDSGQIVPAGAKDVRVVSASSPAKADEKPTAMKAPPSTTSAGGVGGVLHANKDVAVYVGPTLGRAPFTIEFPRTVQEYQAHLWSKGRDQMGGTMTMEGRSFGFHAVRKP